MRLGCACPFDPIDTRSYASTSRSAGTCVAPYPLSACSGPPRRDVLRACVGRRACWLPGSDPDVPVVKSSKDGGADERGQAIDLWRALGGNRGLVTQASVRLGNVVVLLDQLPQQRSVVERVRVTGSSQRRFSDGASGTTKRRPLRAADHMLMRAEDRRGYSYRAMCLLAGLCAGFQGFRRVHSSAYGLTLWTAFPLRARL